MLSPSIFLGYKCSTLDSGISIKSPLSTWISLAVVSSLRNLNRRQMLFFNLWALEFHHDRSFKTQINTWRVLSSPTWWKLTTEATLVGELHMTLLMKHWVDFSLNDLCKVRGEQSNKQDREVLLFRQNATNWIDVTLSFISLLLFYSNKRPSLTYNSLIYIITFTRDIFFSKRKQWKLCTSKAPHL